MAMEITEIEAAQHQYKEDQELELRREQEQNPNWTPAEGAGVVPEDVWNSLEKKTMQDKVNANIS